MEQRKAEKEISPAQHGQATQAMSRYRNAKFSTSGVRRLRVLHIPVVPTHPAPARHTLFVGISALSLRHRHRHRISFLLYFARYRELLGV